MEFGGVLGLDGLVGESSDHQSGGRGRGRGEEEESCPFSTLENSNSSEAKMRKNGIFGGCFLKHGRSTEADQEQQVDYWRSLKVARNSTAEAITKSSSSAAVPFLFRSNSHSSIFSDGEEQMLSFSSSSSKPEDNDHAALYLNNDGSLSSSYQYLPSSYSSASAPSFYRNAGLANGSTNVSLHGVNGPFTPSQWMELEHQALIYKYIDANIRIPSSLLIPIRRSTNPSAISPFLSGSLRSNTFGWGPFHLGFSGNTDPEPGRCRRTDGKKWRCSRDAVADQKYCERHMNRGRHRSRKHVEGQTGHASKPVPIIAPSQQTAAVSGGGGGGGGGGGSSQQRKSLQPNVIKPSPPSTNRIQVSKEGISDYVQDSNSLSILSDVSRKPIDSLFPISKHHNPFEGTPSRSDFGLISSDSLLNPLRTPYNDDIGFGSTSELNNRQPQHNPLRHFIDDWPKSQTDNPSITWPRVEETKSDRTQLSISIPSDISSSSPSPIQEKLALSPLRLSRDFNPMNGRNQRQASWIPISWEPTLGGPLGEVLNKTNCSSSSLKLLTDGWDTSPRFQSSPTGIMQKTTFGSVSSSTGSSPRAENQKAHDSTNQCDNLLGSTHCKLLTPKSSDNNMKVMH